MNGFLTDPAESVERLTVTKPCPHLGFASNFKLDLASVSDTLADADMLQPHAIVFCKGWSRSYVFIFVLLLAYEHPHFLEVRYNIWGTGRGAWLFFQFRSWN